MVQFLQLIDQLVNGALRTRGGSQGIDHRRLPEERIERIQDTIGQGIEMIAAFEYEQDPALTELVCHADQRLGDRGVPRYGERHVGQRIGPVSVVSCRDEDQIWIESLGQRPDQRLQDASVTVIPHIGWKRHVQRCSPAGSPSHILLGAGAWIVRVLMGRKVEHVRVIREERRGAVAMVHVEIGDENPFEFLLRQCRSAATATLLNRQKPMARSAMA